MLNLPSCELGFIVDLLWQKFGWFFGLARGFSPGFSGFLSWQTSLWCRCLNRGQHYKLAILYSTAHVWFTCSTRVDGKGPLLSFDCCLPSWYNCFSLPSFSTAVKIKDGSLIFTEKILSTHLHLHLHQLYWLSKNLISRLMCSVLFWTVS